MVSECVASPDHAVRSNPDSGKRVRHNVTRADDRFSLLQRGDGARWAISELDADPYLALSHAIWPKARVAGSRQSRTAC